MTDTTPDDSAIDVPVDAPVSVTFSENVTFAGTVDIVCTSGTQTVTPTGGPATFNLLHTDFALSDACSITILASQVTDQDGTPTPMAADYTWDFAVTNGCFGASTPVHDIQGTGLSSPLVGQAHSVEALVVADYQADSTIRGFFVEEPDGEQDANPATSEGLFVYDNNFGVDVAVGDYVRVTGTVSEYQQQTQLNSVTAVTICENGPQEATPISITLPFTATAVPERFEGMSVAMTQTLTVNETYNLGRGGILTLANGRLQQPTNVVLPGAPANALQAANNLNQITLDDGSLVEDPDPIIYPPPELTALHTVRSGDTVSDTVGVLTQGNPGWTSPGILYRIYPYSMPTFTATNPRPAAPDPVRAGGSLRVSSFNVLNYFTTIDNGANNCGPAQNQNCRGADSNFEFTRQRNKLLQALDLLDADVLGVMELENTLNVALEPLLDLVNGLNGIAGPGAYDYIDVGTIMPGNHVIKVGLIYKPAVVRPIGNFALLDISVNPNFNTALNRPALAQTFEEIATGGRFTVIVNHLKSKGCTGATGLDTDQNDGQSCFNYTRTLAANALAAWAASDPTGMGDPDVLMMGDLNAYSREDPIRALETGGYTELEINFEGPDAYSYVFSSQAGSLDHSLANASLLPQVNDATTWHINADEPIVLDYNVEFKNANQQNILYNADAYRTSDHDPLLIGLNLTPSQADLSVSKVDDPDPAPLGGTVVYTVTAQNNGTALALDVVITDTLPAALTYLGATANTGECAEDAGVVTCQMGSMANGAIETVVISATVAQATCGDVITNTVEVASGTLDNQPNNNVDEEPTTVGCIPPNIDAGPASISSAQLPNVQTQHTLTISNTGQADLNWEIFEEPATVPAALPAGPAPATRFDSQAALPAEMSGLEAAGAVAVTPRDPAAHARAKRLLLTTGLLLVPDWSADRVMAFDPATGNLVDANFIPPDSAHLASPKHAILSAAGNTILVSDQVNDVVQEYDLDGNWIRIFAPAGGVNNAILDNIRGISLDASGNLLVTVASGANSNAIAKFDTNGNYLGNFIAAGTGGLAGPYDLWNRSAEWLVSSDGSNNVLRFDLAGAFLAVFAPVNSFPQQIGVAGNGNVLVGNFSGTQEGVVEFTPAGALVGVYDPAAVGGYRGAYELPNGNILTSNGNGVYEIDRSNNLVSTKITGANSQFIEYVVIQTECTNPADIPWAAVSPISGTVPGGEATDVTVTLDSTGLTPGAYTGRLCVTSDDPDPGPGNGTDLAIVPLTLTVEAPPVPAIALAKTVGANPAVCATTDEITVPAGTEVTYCYEVSNTGNVTLNYHDLVDSELGALLSGLFYTLAPGASTFVTQTTTINATTVNTATWTAYNPNYIDLVTATDAATVTVETPNIDVSPLSLSQTHATPQVTTVPLTVANTGNETLTWSIVEEPTGVTPAPLSGGDATVARDVVDLSGANVPEQPSTAAPLVDWQAPEAVLYDNGPLVTHPGGGAGGANASAVQTALGNSTFGFGNQVSAGNRVADDFTVPAGGWLVNTITFFGYQTGSTTTSTFTDLNLRIWDGPPNDPASLVVFGDTTTNRLASSTWTNIYRVTDTALTGSTRPIMANVATVNTFLPTGTYWLDWQAAGTLASGPWAPPVTILGQTGKPGANALQYTATGWASLIDAGNSTAQDLPFIVDGTVAAECSNPSDVPWLSEVPSSGNTPGGGSTPVTVSFDSTGLTPGTYTANLCITSNDPDPGPGNGTELVVVPVTLTLNSPTAVTLSGLAAGQKAAPAPVSVPVGVVMLGIAAAAVWLRRR